MKRKTPYSLVAVNSVCLESVISARRGQGCTVGVDVAKGDLVACLYWPDRSFERPWRIASPGQVPLLVGHLKELSAACPVVVAMESSGVYGDVLRQALGDAGILVRRVSSKAVKDHAETFDGVPSQHDGKDAAVIGELAALGKSSPWPWEQRSEEDQALRFWVRKLDTAQRIRQVHCGKLEALLSRHWPEVGALVKQSAPTLTQALAHWGDPRVLAGDPKAAELLKGFGGFYLRPEKIERLIASAASTLGVRMTAWQAREMRETAAAIVRGRQEIKACRNELKKLTAHHPVIVPQAAAIGLITACVLWMCVGDPRHYGSAAAYRKAMGLNLKERSSGAYQGRLSISKRGQRLARKWIYFSALRWTRDKSIRPWLEAKKRRDGGKGRRAVVGVMRRLAKAAYHVGKHGEAFDPARLFPGATRARAAAPAGRT